MNSQSILNFCFLAFAVIILAGCSTTDGHLGDRTANIAVWTPEHDPELRSLLKERYDAAVSAYKTEMSLQDAGKSTTDFTLRLADLVAQAESALAETPEQFIQALGKHLEVTKQFELEAQQRIRLGPRPPSSEEALTRSWRLAAEIALLRAKHHFQKR
jgi:hypothetical protein